MRNLMSKSFFLALALVLSSTSLLLAQDSSSMTGVVTDATGAVLPGTVVTLSNPSTGATFTQTTDSQGIYRFLNVAPGAGYKATFSAVGFSVAEITNISLSVGITRTQNAKLAVGAAAQTVEVSAGNAQVTLDTTDATIGNNIDVEELNNLPVYDRTVGISNLFYQQPGVDSNTGAVTGARIDQTEVTVDGLDVNDIAAGTTFAVTATAPVDSVQQFTGTVAGLTSVRRHRQRRSVSTCHQERHQPIPRQRQRVPSRHNHSRQLLVQQPRRRSRAHPSSRISLAATLAAPSRGISSSSFSTGQTPESFSHHPQNGRFRCRRPWADSSPGL